MTQVGRVLGAMLGYYAGDARRINHFLKVYGFAKAIGEAEGLDAREELILELAALTHDIGIKNSEAKYGSTAGRYQELEGPPEAEKLLVPLGLERDIVDRVLWLIGHHHTYSSVVSRDHQILMEADFLVNAFEDGLTMTAVSAAAVKIFRTETGKALLRTVYPGASV